MKSPRMMRRRYRNEKIIQHYDSSVDKDLLHNNTLSTHGYEIFKIDELLECGGLSERLRCSDLRQSPQDNQKVLFSWQLPDFLWQAILTSEKLSTLVTEYLGNKARLDDLYLKTVVDGYDATAEGWHNDNVGYRLKVFMVFDTEGRPSATVVKPAMRPNLYKVNYGEEFLRTIKIISKQEHQGEVVVNYNPGDCLVFDTNLAHRGSYNAGTGTRYCIVIEFIDRDKANALRGIAPCGPRQGRGTLEIPELIGVNLKEHKLIDTDLLQDCGTNYRYGYTI